MKAFMTGFLLCFLFMTSFSQESESERDTTNVLFTAEKEKLLKNITMTMDMRLAFRHHWENGRDDDYSEFRNEQLAMGIFGKVHEKVDFYFRHRFNRETDVQTLDKLGGSIELAYIDIQLTPHTHVQLGKQFAYFGGFEYEYNPIDVLSYNDIQDNLLNYVTGVITEQITEDHSLGFQILNSRTQRYADLYAGKVADNIEEPKWPVAVVGNWSGSFFGGKFETIYSYSYSKQVKDKGTHFVTLGNKFEHGDFKLMYDFDYAKEDVDTKGIVTAILDADKIQQNVLYMENWLRAEYRFSQKVTGLVTLMTSSAFGKDVTGPGKGNERLRISYGVVPTIYYRPFEDIDIRFYGAFIGRKYNFKGYARHDLGIQDYTTGEIRIGFIAPLTVL